MRIVLVTSELSGANNLIPSWDANSSPASQKFLVFYGNRRFTRAHNRVNISRPSHPISLKSFLILYSHFKVGLVPSLQAEQTLPFWSSPCLQHCQSLSPNWHDYPSNSTHLVKSTNYKCPHFSVMHSQRYKPVSQPYKTTIKITCIF